MKLALALLLGFTCVSCTAEIAGHGMDRPGDTGEPDAGPSEPDPSEPDPSEPEPDPTPDPDPEPTPGFDVNDPSDYRWTMTLEAYYTLEVLRGTAQVQWSRFAPGIDPKVGTASESGTLAGAASTLALDLRYSELTGSVFQLRTLRAQDGQPMTSCLKLVEGTDAIESHNEILSEGYPLFDRAGFTNPTSYAARLVATPGVLLFVNADCNEVSESNPSELRSVLDFAAVTLVAAPDPQVFDPAMDPDPGAGIHP